MKRAAAFVRLPLEGDVLPTRFPVLAAGENRFASPEGDDAFLFDAAAAESVMNAFHRRRGVRLMIDLQHDSVNPAARASRSDAADARGWCDLELSADGGLWATAVEWTPDGVERLRSKTQRYISPIVLFSEEGRVEEIFNLALVSSPALHGVPSLVAARSLEGAMDPKIIAQALDVLIAGDAPAAIEILKRLVAEAAGASAESEAGEENEDMPPEPASAAEAPPPVVAATPNPDSAAHHALATALSTALGSTSDDSVSLVAEVRKLKARTDALELQRRAEELETRSQLIGKLVNLGAELPCTAWSDPDTRTPSAAMAALSLSDLEARVAAFEAASRFGQVSPPKAEVGALSPSDQRRAEKISDPEKRDRFVALRLARGVAGGVL